MQLVELVSANKSTTGRASPSLSTQTQAPWTFLCQVVILLFGSNNTFSKAFWL
jgi:hypothetical protein